MSNVVDLTTKIREWTLNFRCPQAFSMNSGRSKNLVHLEVADGEGTAIVRASNKNAAKKELHKILPVTEWIE